MRRKRKKTASAGRRESRSMSQDLQGPISMYEQMRQSFGEFAADESSPYTYAELLAHYNLLWQKYAARKNKKRNNRHPVEPDFFHRMNKPLEVEKEPVKIFEIIRNKIGWMTTPTSLNLV